jgi:hypothetical protein
LDIEPETSELFRFRLIGFIGSLTPDGLQVAGSGRWPYQAWWAKKARNPAGKTAIRVISANIHISCEAFDVV